jgi:hypothetical protein
MLACLAALAWIGVASINSRGAVRCKKRERRERKAKHKRELRQ